MKPQPQIIWIESSSCFIVSASVGVVRGGGSPETEGTVERPHSPDTTPHCTATASLHDAYAVLPVQYAE